MFTIETLIEILKTMSTEEWTELYKQAESTIDTKDERIITWNSQYTDSSNEAVTIYNYMYKLVEQGRIDELPESLKKLVDDWNSK